MDLGCRNIQFGDRCLGTLLLFIYVINALNLIPFYNSSEEHK